MATGRFGGQPWNVVVVGAGEAAVNIALTACPPVWRGVDSYLGGETTIPVLLSNPIARAALATAGLLT